VDDCPALWADIVRFQDPVLVSDFEETTVEETEEVREEQEQEPPDDQQEVQRQTAPPAEPPVQQIAVDPQDYAPENDAQSLSDLYLQSEESGEENPQMGFPISVELPEEGEIVIEEEQNKETLRPDGLKRSSPPMVDTYS
jgi:hypothetical protein